MKTESTKLKELLQRVEEIKKNGGSDLSTAEDLSVAVMNLISLEEHFFFTGAKTKDGSYYDLSGEIRDLRKSLMRELVPRHEGETWCATKHLLSSTMRLIEVGNKLKSDGKNKEAKEMFERAYRVYSIFWGIKAKLLGVHDKSKEGPWSLEDLVNKLADCCNE